VHRAIVVRPAVVIIIIIIIAIIGTIMVTATSDSEGCQLHENPLTPSAWAVSNRETNENH